MIEGAGRRCYVVNNDEVKAYVEAREATSQGKSIPRKQGTADRSWK